MRNGKVIWLLADSSLIPTEASFDDLNDTDNGQPGIRFWIPADTTLGGL